MSEQQPVPATIAVATVLDSPAPSPSVFDRIKLLLSPLSPRASHHPDVSDAELIAKFLAGGLATSAPGSGTTEVDGGTAAAPFHEVRTATDEHSSHLGASLAVPHSGLSSPSGGQSQSPSTTPFSAHLLLSPGAAHGTHTPHSATSPTRLRIAIHVPADFHYANLMVNTEQSRHWRHSIQRHCCRRTGVVFRYMASEKAVYLDASVRGGDDVARVLGHLEAAAVAVHEWLASECARQGFGETPNPIVPQ